jgi:hypothetical protein
VSESAGNASASCVVAESVKSIKRYSLEKPFYLAREWETPTGAEIDVFKVAVRYAKA